MKILDYAGLLEEQAPEFRSAAQPVAAKPREPNRRYWLGPADKRPAGAEVFHPELEFAAFAARGFTPLAIPGGLAVGPTRMTGTCLEPLFGEGDRCYWDPTLPANDGDVVLVRDSEETIQRAVAYNPERYRDGIPNLCAKVLRHFGGQLWLLFNRGAYPLADNQVLGVLRYVERR